MRIKAETSSKVKEVYLAAFLRTITGGEVPDAFVADSVEVVNCSQNVGFGGTHWAFNVVHEAQSERIAGRYSCQLINC